jgi:hypothetical protein
MERNVDVGELLRPRARSGGRDALTSEGYSS